MKGKKSVVLVCILAGEESPQLLVLDKPINILYLNSKKIDKKYFVGFLGGIDNYFLQ